MLTDPVCGASIDPLRARAVAIVAGERYYFCSPEHRDRFIEAPARYVPGLREEKAVIEAAAVSPLPVEAPPPPEAAEVASPTQLLRFEIGGMVGPDDAERVRRAVARVEGVAAAEIDLVSEIATLAVTRGFRADALVAAVSQAGYEAAPRAEATALDAAEARLALQRGGLAAAAAALLAIAGLFLRGTIGLTVVAAAALGAGTLMPRRWARLEAQLLGAAVVLTLAGLAAALGGGRPVAAAGALAAAGLAWLARALEGRAKASVDDALAAVEAPPPTALRVGERVRVAAGELVPVDGVVVAQAGVIDERLAGGSVAQARAPGDAVVAGTRVSEGSVVVEARRVGGERALARVRAAVEALAGSRSPSVRLALRVERWSPLIAAGAALAAFLIALVDGRGLATSLAAAGALLIAVCPLAPALATMARVVAGARAARRGLLFRNAEALERAADLTVLFVDKSATLTQRRRRVAGHAVAPGADVARLLALAAAAEQATDTPLARALRAYAEQHGVRVPPAEAASYTPGKGVTATVAGVTVSVGSRRMAEAAGADAATIDALAVRGSPLYVLVGGKLEGAFGVEDPPRAGASTFVAALRGRGLRVVMVTGDEATAAQALAAETGVDEWHAGLTPDGKKRLVADARAAGATVGVAGDSVDDAAALAAADVGIALARGAEVELASGGVTVLRGDLDGVIAAIDTARRATLVLRGGLALALAHPLLVLIAVGALALGPAAPLLAAATPQGVVGVRAARAGAGGGGGEVPRSGGAAARGGDDAGGAGGARGAARLAGEPAALSDARRRGGPPVMGVRRRAQSGYTTAARMRTCPSCQRTYAADATQCTVDGRSLVDVSLSDTVPSASAAASSPAVVDAVGAALAGRYDVLRKIGEGGMGVVFEARHAKIGKRVAVKVLLDKYLEKPDVVARLLQEARLASSIGHENIVDITDFGETDDGRTFVVMEFLEGESLAALLDREGALPAARAVHIVRQVASALGAAHEKGIIHRDVKPENIFITRRGDRDFVKVLDFGISKAMKAPDDDTPASSPRLTQTGMVIGTPLYMSPEQASGEENLDHRIDVYALGTVLYEALTGEVPFHGPNYLSIISQILSREPRPPSEARPELGITPDLENVVLRAMAKAREDRYPTMAELDADLARIEGGASVRLPAVTRLARRRVATVAAWIGGVAAIVVGVALTVPRVVRDAPANVAAEPPPAVAPPPTPAPVAAPLPPPPPARVKVRVASTPSGAEVWWEAVKKGETPLELEFPKSNEQIELTLKLAGHVDAKVPVIPTEDQEIPATLTPVPRPRPRPRPGTHKAPPPPRDKGPTGGGEIKDNPYPR